MLAHPQGSTSMMTNLAEVGPNIMAQLHEEVAVMPTLAPRVEAFASLLRERLGPRHGLQSQPAAGPSPILTMRFATPYGELAFFTLFTTFGSPRDITLSSLRLEHMCPVDAQTRTILESAAGLSLS